MLQGQNTRGLRYYLVVGNTKVMLVIPFIVVIAFGIYSLGLDEISFFFFGLFIISESGTALQQGN